MSELKQIFRFVPIQLAEGRPLAEQLGAVLRIPRASFRAGGGHGSSTSSHG